MCYYIHNLWEKNYENGNLVAFKEEYVMAQSHWWKNDILPFYFIFNFKSCDYIISSTIIIFW